MGLNPDALVFYHGNFFDETTGKPVKPIMLWQVKKVDIRNSEVHIVHPSKKRESLVEQKVHVVPLADVEPVLGLNTLVRLVVKGVVTAPVWRMTKYLGFDQNHKMPGDQKWQIRRRIF